MNNDGINAIMETANAVEGRIPALTLQTSLTQVLTNVVDDLVNLRKDIEKSQMKDIADVRKFDPSNPGTSHLGGIEFPVTYPALVALISEMQLGLAMRRVNHVQGIPT